MPGGFQNSGWKKVGKVIGLCPAEQPAEADRSTGQSPIGRQDTLHYPEAERQVPLAGNPLLDRGRNNSVLVVVRLNKNAVKGSDRLLEMILIHHKLNINLAHTLVDCQDTDFLVEQ